MAITGSNLIANEGTSASSFVTASISPGAGALVIVSVAGDFASTTIPTVTGAGGTWVLIASQLSGTGARVVALFRDLSMSPGSGALTIDWGGQSQAVCDWSVDQFTGVDTSGTNGSVAVVQNVKVGTSSSTTTGNTLTLAALTSTDNAAYGFIRQNTAAAITAGSGFTQLSNQTDTPNTFVCASEWAINNTAVAWTWASQACITVAIAIEIRAISLLVPRPEENMPDRRW